MTAMKRFSTGLFGEAFRFGVVGAVATAVHYAAYWLLMDAIGVNVAYTLGYVMSFLLNFWLTARFTFRTKPSWRKLAGMSGAHAVNWLLHIVLLNLFLSFGVPRGVAPVPVFAVAIPVNFLLVRFVFKHKLS